MTAPYPAECCSTTPRFTVNELFERGFRRRRAAPLPIEGAARTDVAGNFARFSLAVADGRIAAVGFRCASCATLIAYCELIAETVPGRTVEMARALTAQEAIATLPGIPSCKQDRAVLAVAAFRAALESIPIHQRKAEP
jgi:NifU-like protein involved in Fe-S cluster formation